MITSPVVLGLLGLLVAAFSLRLWLLLGMHSLRPWTDAVTREALARPDPRWLVAAAGLGALTYLMVPPSPAGAIAAGLLGSLLAALCRIDLGCRMLPDSLTAAMLAGALLFHGLLGELALTDSIIGALAGYGLLWGLSTAFGKIRGVTAMGRGDFAMAAAIGAWVGWIGLPMALATASISGLMLALLAHLSRRTSEPKPHQADTPTLHACDTQSGKFLHQEIPFGPFLAAGFLLSWSVHG
jgi:prepilin signal peptidase PulO-like enzyme (type II secretory pathway)